MKPTKQTEREYLCLVVSLILSGGAAASGLDPVSRSGEITTGPQEGIAIANTDLVVAPIPIANPTIGSGLAIAAMYLYPLDANSPSSITGAGGAYTDSESWAVGLMQRTYLDGDRYRINATAAYGEFNYDFYGIGNDAGGDGVSIPLRQHGYALIPEISFRVSGGLYLGVRLRYLSVSTELPDRASEFANAPDDNALEVISSGIGLLATYDTRDREFSPRSGMLIDFRSNVARGDFGSDFDYETYELAANGYFGAWRNDVVAIRAYACNASSKAPFFDICLFGMNSDLRGYVGGQYRDRAMATTQVEYRATLTERFGVVAFAGIGAVGSSFDDLGGSLSSVGAGLRYVAAPRQGVTLSLDYAAGRDTEAWYVYIGDAF